MSYSSIKSKPCTVDNCSNPRFAKGYCKIHQYLRTDKKKPKPLKSKPIIKKKDKNTGQMALFSVIWNTRDRVSFISGKPLNRYEGTNFFPNLFAHVLSKAQNKYHKFKLYDKNIVLLTPEEHTLFDHGTEEQREKYKLQNPSTDWEKLYNLKEQLKKEYISNYGY